MFFHRSQWNREWSDCGYHRCRTLRRSDQYQSKQSRRFIFLINTRLARICPCLPWDKGSESRSSVETRVKSTTSAAFSSELAHRTIRAGDRCWQSRYHQLRRSPWNDLLRCSCVDFERVNGQDRRESLYHIGHHDWCHIRVLYHTGDSRRSNHYDWYSEANVWPVSLHRMTTRKAKNKCTRMKINVKRISISQWTNFENSKVINQNDNQPLYHLALLWCILVTRTSFEYNWSLLCT